MLPALKRPLPLSGPSLLLSSKPIESRLHLGNLQFIIIFKHFFAYFSAPPVKSIQYTAPAAPVLKAALAPAVYAAPSFAGPVSTYGAPAVALSAAYAAPAHQKVLAHPTLALSVPSFGLASQGLLSAYAPQGVGLTTYGSPSLGYSLGSYAAAPAAVYKAAAPVAEYGH